MSTTVITIIFDHFQHDSDPISDTTNSLTRTLFFRQTPPALPIAELLITGLVHSSAVQTLMTFGSGDCFPERLLTARSMSIHGKSDSQRVQNTEEIFGEQILSSLALFNSYIESSYQSIEAMSRIL